MARPANPLDIFVTYTTHFELHASTEFEELKKLANYDANLSTTARESTGTLLINTRRDAHQSIDNVRYQMISNSGDPTAAMIASTDLSLDVVESGGTFFLEKLKKHAEKLAASGLTDSLIFGLKIIFVGRKQDNSIVTQALPYIIPLQLINANAKFDHKGGEYSLSFIVSAFAGAPSERNKSALSVQAGFINRDITIKARTVKEALAQLEEKLNDNYKKTYETELKNTVGARTMAYKINYNLGIDGNLDSVSTESYKKGDYIRMTFHRSEDIVEMVRRIIYTSKSLCEAIGQSAPGLRKELHPGVKIPTFTPRYHLKAGKLELAIDINFYQGGGKKYEFDFLFSKPGQNVDVMEFEVRLPNIMVAFNSMSSYGQDLNINASSTVAAANPEFYGKQVVTPDVTVKQMVGAPAEQKAINSKKNGIAALPAVPISESTGQASMRHDSVKSRRLAFDATSQLATAMDQQFTFTIRGHFDIISDCIAYPDGTLPGFGTNEGMWLKVNIHDKDGLPFYYTGYYQVITVDNVFSQGKFIQMITVMQMPETSSNTTTQ